MLRVRGYPLRRSAPSPGPALLHGRHLTRCDFKPYGELIDGSKARAEYVAALHAYAAERVGGVIAATWPQLSEAPAHVQKARMH